VQHDAENWNLAVKMAPHAMRAVTKTYTKTGDVSQAIKQFALMLGLIVDASEDYEENNDQT